MAIAFNLVSGLVGKGWKPTEIRFFRDPPLDMEPFRQHFQTRMRFGAEQAAIVFPSADLARPLPTSDSNAYAEALRQLEELDASSETHLFSNQVRRLLRRLFINGSGLQRVDLQRTAQLLALHPRTLNRRLHIEGKNFSAVLDETRYEVARQLLRDTALRIEDISVMLGYAGAASFDHAFRRWSGTTATDWRSLEQSNRTGSGFSRPR